MTSAHPDRRTDDRPTADARAPLLGTTLPFALPIGLSAFLLFSVEPLVGRLVLPVFGGTPAVWATVLFFFQAVLLVGLPVRARVGDAPRAARGRRSTSVLAGARRRARCSSRPVRVADLRSRRSRRSLDLLRDPAACWSACRRSC